MQQRENIEAKLRELKPVLIQKFHVERIGYFGSYTRDEQNDNSDIDILVSFSKPLGWEFFDLKDFLETELQIKVDLVSEKGLKNQLKQLILNSTIFL